MTEEILLFHGRVMSPHPAGVKLETVAKRLRAEIAVGVELCPGDGTSYRLLIAPAWSPRYFDASAGVGPEGTGYLIVGYYTGMHAFRRGTTWQYVAEKLNLRGLSAEWTARFLAWWLGQLWDAIDKEAAT